MLKLYNTLTAKKEKFKPLKNKKVNIFVCGITAYDFAHIGHARSFLFYDVLVKYLKYLGYKVFYLQNITDIDDKIINRAKKENISAAELAKKFSKEYLKDVKTLKINSVDKYALATKHIKEIISQIEKLIKKGFAYQIEDGIYYNTKKFKNYGKLSGRTSKSAESAVSRIDEALNKKNKADFCLWKFSKQDEPKWKSPWGYGRPGWHIEDTAITQKFFGFQYDIHGGARDLIFPHHEAEIAQMEAISGKRPMVKYWVHTGFLTVNKEKMSKSLNNFITIRDFLKNNSPRLLRFFFLKTHYRSPLDYNERNIHQAKKELEKIDNIIKKLKTKENISKEKNVKDIRKIKKELLEALNDDFNTSLALSKIFEIGEIANKLNKKEKEETLKILKEIDSFLGFIFWKEKKEQIPLSVKKLVKKREKLRKEKKWEEADKIRNQIKKAGFEVKDTNKGTILIKISV